ncbi:prenyltransferase [Rhodoferax sp.]|uniref:prenyltransferase n=1 Tax=Rhodoferax sp. TaxID=50421 RepID=UPI002850FA2E|nr:prenyltransferase [Rhodoferax sp.]MDR3369813.1 prenyltransferase [Rhodoferax sp.]
MTPNDTHEISLVTVWQLSRPASLSVTAVAWLLGLASAAGCGISLDWASALAALLLTGGFHAGTNILHAYHAARQEAAGGLARSPLSANDGIHLIRQGRITLAQTRQVAWAVLGLVMIAGLALAVKVGGGLLLLGLAGLMLTWAFTAAPLKLEQWGGAEIGAALAGWLAVLGTDYTQRHHFFLVPAVDAWSFALLVAAIPLTQRATWPATPKPRLDLNAIGALYVALIVLAYAWLVGGVSLLYQPRQALWGLLSLPVSLAAAAWLWGAGRQPQRACRAWQLSLVAALLHGLAMAGGLVTVTMF